MLVHKLGHYPTRFHLDGEITPLYRYGTFPSRLERMHARGGHMQAPIYTNLSPHPHTYARGTCKFSSHSNVLVVFLRRNPDLCAHSDRLPPRCSSDRGSPSYLSLVLCLFRS